MDEPRIQVLTRVDPLANGANCWSDLVSGPVVDPLSSARFLKSCEEAGHSTRGEVHLARKVCDAGWFVSQGFEQPEGPLDTLDGGRHSAAITSGP